MALEPALRLEVRDASQAGAVRRAAVALAQRLAFDETTAGRLALIVTEIATNIVKHAGRGEILLCRRPAAVDVLGLDRAPGIANVARSLEDGFSTAGSAGTGLGAVRRLASHFDIYSREGQGTAVLATVATSAVSGRAVSGLEVGGLAVAKAGETECGDAWVDEHRSSGLALVVVDGLGHGAGAQEAAVAGVHAFGASRGRAPHERLASMHDALRPTRGAAAAVVEIDLDRRVVAFAGLGNIGGVLVGPDGMRHLVSHNGTLGHVGRRLGGFTYPWAPKGVLVMYSDGLATLRDLAAYPGLLAHHPRLIAGVLYRDFGRGRDDATVVVVKEAA